MAAEVAIGRFAELTGLTIKTLRHYDAIGLLSPTRVDPNTGYRYYRTTQVREAMIIKALRGVDVGLDRTAALLANWGDVEHVRAELKQQRLHLEAARELAEHRLSIIERLLERNDTMPYEVTTKQLEPTPVVLVRTVMRLDERGMVEGRRTPAIYDQLAAHLDAKGVRWCPPGVLITHAFNDEARDSSYGLCVQTATDTDGIFEFCVLPGGEFLSVTHIGPFEEVHAAFAAMEEALQERNFTPRGDWRLLAHDDAASTPPTHLRSEVLVPL